MDQDNVRITLSGLSDVDRLELEKAFGRDNVQTMRQQTRPGQLGEPGLLEAVVTISLAAIPVIGAWLAQSRRRLVIKDDIEVATKQGTVRRKLRISAQSSDAVAAEVVKELTEMASAASAAAGAQSKSD